MTDDITKSLTDSEKLDFLINAVSDIRLRQVALEERQSTLEQLVRDRLYDTRPLWQAVLQQLEQINARLDGQQQVIEQIKAHQKRHDEMLTQMLQRLAVLNDDVLVVRGGHRELRERVAILEAA